jgi:hypothetical protein
MIYARKPEPMTVQGVCTVSGCGNKQAPTGRGLYRALCGNHWRKSFPNHKPKTRKYRANKKSYCERCGPEVEYDSCQLDVDHIDEDHTNDDPDNHQTLCANCHRLKTLKPHLFCER